MNLCFICKKEEGEYDIPLDIKKTNCETHAKKLYRVCELCSDKVATINYCPICNTGLEQIAAQKSSEVPKPQEVSKNINASVSLEKAQESKKEEKIVTKKQPERQIKSETETPIEEENEDGFMVAKISRLGIDTVKTPLIIFFHDKGIGFSPKTGRWSLIEGDSYYEDSFIFWEDSAASYLEFNSTKGNSLVSGGISLFQNQLMGTSDCYFLNIKEDGQMDVTKAPSLLQGRHLHSSVSYIDKINKKTLVYAIGGKYEDQWLNSCEVFDTSKEKWEPIASMKNPRAQFGACILDKKIYVLGGFENYGGAMAKINIEVFDVDSNIWSEFKLQDGNVNLAGLSLVPVDNKHFAIVGGSTGDNVTTTFSLINVATGAVIPLKSLLFPAVHAYTILKEDHLYVMGGLLSQGICQKYSFKDRSWEECENYLSIVQSLTEEGGVPEAEMLLKPYVVSSHDTVSNISSVINVPIEISANVEQPKDAIIFLRDRALVFSFNEEKWIQANITSTNKTSINLLDNASSARDPYEKTAVYTGGYFEEEKGPIYGVSDAYLIQLQKNENLVAQCLPPMLEGRYCHSSAFLKVNEKGKVYAFGGKRDEKWLESGEVLDLSTQKWEKFASMRNRRAQFSSIVIGAKIYAFGGFEDFSTLAKIPCEVYDSEKNEWNEMKLSGRFDRLNAATSVLKISENKVLLIGGSDGNVISDSSLLIDLDTGRVEEAACNIGSRASFHSFVANQSLYIFGGFGGFEEHKELCEKFDVGLRKLIPVASYEDLLEEANSEESSLDWRCSVAI